MGFGAKTTTNSFRAKMNRVLLFCVLLSATTPHARADDTWQNIFHTLKRFFTGDDRHHSAKSRGHRPLSHSHAHSDANSSHEQSAEPRVIVLPGTTPELSGDTAKPVETKPTETPPAVTKPEEVKPQEVKPQETKPPESTPTPNPSPVLRSLQ
jgi:hypothetical protein